MSSLMKTEESVISSGCDRMSMETKTPFDEISCFDDVPEYQENVEATFAQELKPTRYGPIM
jgi:hypothetical protein